MTIRSAAAPRSTFGLLATITLLAVVTLACSDDQNASTPPPEPTHTGERSPDLDPAEPSIESGSDSDISLTEAEAEAVIYVAGYYAWERDEFEEFATAEQEALILQQDAIFSCMKAEGFEYHPEEVGRVSWLPWYSVDPDSREWIDVYGIGYSTTLLPQEVAGDHAVGYLGDPPPGPQISEESAETQYLSSLPEDEYRQYLLALTGLDTNELSPSTEQREIDDETRAAIDASCQGQAMAEHPVPDPVDHDDRSGLLAQRVKASPEWLGYTADGWRCVREAGVEAHNIENAEQLVADRLTSSGVFDRLGQLPRGLNPLPPDLANELAAVQDYEREIAAIIWDCGVHPIQAQDFFIELTRSFVVAE